MLKADRDVIADAFEEFIGTAFRGGEGQFFTPRNVVQMMIDVLQPTSGEKVIDPACGSGGFLAYIAKHFLHKKAKNTFLGGIEKDAFLSRLAKIYLALIGQENFSIFCENSLEQPAKWQSETQSVIELGTFDVVLTNPPFGAKIPVVGDALLRQYELGSVWKEHEGKWLRTKSVQDKQPPQILFIERCLQLLKNGGRMGIVLPEGIFGNPSERYVWEFVRTHSNVIGVVSLSQETFQPSTHTKTSVLFLEKTERAAKKVFMAIAKAVGHDKNGKETYKFRADGLPLVDENNNKILDDDLPEITKNFRVHLNGGLREVSYLGFDLPHSELKKHVFIPEYYNPEIKEELENLEKTGKYHLVSIGDLIKEKVIEIRRGNEIGSRFYGTGKIPFVRTTDIVNWEIKIDPIKAVAEEVYEQYKKSQDVREKDILFVNDGTFLIGRTAMVTRLDEKIIIQSHIKKIRALQPERLSPFYLFYLLNSKIFKKQVEAKTFVQATISTIGNRLSEIVLPVNYDPNEIKRIEKEVREIIFLKTSLRERSMKLMEESI
jgi:type I restriction enzyme M protein